MRFRAMVLEDQDYLVVLEGQLPAASCLRLIILAFSSWLVLMEGSSKDLLETLGKDDFVNLVSFNRL